MTWDEAKQTAQFIATNFRSIVISGAILWIIVVMSLQLAGLIDAKARCGWCLDMLPKFVTDAQAAPVHPALLHPVHLTPIEIEVVLLPGLSS